MKRKAKILWSFFLLFILVFSFILSACSSRTTSNSNLKPPTKAENHDVTAIYGKAIGDYIRLTKKEYNLTFDTLYFGRHVYGQPDDFPDIELPMIIENTNIKLINPDEGKKIQTERNLSFYINLIGWVNNDKADFTFVTFSNGLAHQFDCFINYKYNVNKKVFEVAETRFEYFLYKKK